MMTQSTAADFDRDFHTVEQRVYDRMVVGMDDDNEWIRDQLRDAAVDATNNAWVEGLTVDQWVEAASK